MTELTHNDTAAIASDENLKMSSIFGKKILDSATSADFISDDDCGIILKSNGSFTVFAPKSSKMIKFSTETGGKMQSDTRFEQLRGLAVACAHPQIMQVLLNLAAELSADQ